MKTNLKILIVLAVLIIMGTTGTLIRYDQLVPIKANQIINTPAGSIASDNVQGALNELDGEKAPSSTVSNATHTGDATGSTALTLATVNTNIGTYNNVTINGKGLATGGSNVAYLTSEVDGSTSNELQTISKVGSTVTLSNSGGSFTDDNTTYSTFNSTTAGLVPASGGGTVNFLRADGSFAAPPVSSYTLPVANSTDRGGIKIGYTPQNNTLAVNLNASEQAYVSLSGAAIQYALTGYVNTVGGTSIFGSGDIPFVVPNTSVTYGKLSVYNSPSAGDALTYDATYGLKWTAQHTGSGVSGRVAYWNGTNSLTSNAGFTFDGSNLTLGGNVTGAEVYRGSSRKLKTNIEPYKESATELLKNTKIYLYNLKSNGSKGVGFIAEETNPILSGDDQVAHLMGNHLGVLTKAFQEQDERISKLTASPEIETLKIIIWLMGFFMLLLSMSVIYLFKTRLK